MDPNQERTIQAAFDGHVPAAEHKAALEAKDAEIAELKAEQELFDRDNADKNRMIDRIADMIGLPHDQELDQTAFDIWFSRQQAEVASFKADADVIRSQERNGSYERDIDMLGAEIDRLTAAKKAALKIADERGRENVELRAEVGWLMARRDSLAASCAKYAAEVAELRAALEPFAKLASTLEDAPNLIGLLTEEDFRRAAAALAQRVTSPIDRGNAIIKAQEAMRDADDRPSEEIIHGQRDEWRW